MIAYTFVVVCNGDPTHRLTFEVFAPDPKRIQLLAEASSPILARENGWTETGNLHYCPLCIVQTAHHGDSASVAEMAEL